MAGGVPLEHEATEGDPGLSVTELAQGNNLVASRKINILKNCGIEHAIFMKYYFHILCMFNTFDTARLASNVISRFEGIKEMSTLIQDMIVVLINKYNWDGLLDKLNCNNNKKTSVYKSLNESLNNRNIAVHCSPTFHTKHHNL